MEYTYVCWAAAVEKKDRQTASLTLLGQTHTLTAKIRLIEPLEGSTKQSSYQLDIRI